MSGKAATHRECCQCKLAFPATRNYFHSKGAGKLESKCRPCKNKADGNPAWTDPRCTKRDNPKKRCECLTCGARRTEQSFQRAASKHAKQLTQTRQPDESYLRAMLCNKSSLSRDAIPGTLLKLQETYSADGQGTKEQMT